MFRLALIDPLTLLGRETSAVLSEKSEIETTYFHTGDEDEHQIAQVAGHAALVPPLDAETALEECDAVLLTSEIEGDRLDVLDRVLESRPDLPFLDAAPFDRYRHLTTVGLDRDAFSNGNRLHIAHPGLVVTSLIVNALAQYEPRQATIALTDPISVFGTHAIELLARQAAQRLQGEEVTERVGNQILAFNMAAHAATRMEADAVRLFPNLSVATTFTLAGCFHGHVTHLGISLDQPATAEEVVQACERTGAILTLPFPLNLDSVNDQNGVLMATPSVSDDGHTVLFQTMVDGNRVGGALTAAEILSGLL